MKKTIFLTIFLLCFVHLISAQQNKELKISSVFSMLIKHTWIKTHEKFGTVQLEFKKDSTYTVMLITRSNEPISGKFSLKGNILIFETDSSCKMKASYTVTFTNETVNFIKKDDQCEGRSEIVPGIWKALKQ